MLTRNTGADGGWYVRCDGCGREILAQVFEDRLVVTDKRHGCRHVAVIPRCELLKIMGACTQTPNIAEGYKENTQDEQVPGLQLGR